jgi:hypothetical protein
VDRSCAWERSQPAEQANAITGRSVQILPEIAN